MPTNRSHAESRLLAAAIGIFVAASSAAYILVDLAGVNWPRYYPVLRVFSVVPIEGEVSMGFYGRFAVALAAGVLITAIFLLVSPILRALHLLRTGYVGIFAATSTWMATAIIVVEEWHVWGLEKRGLDNAEAINPELQLFGWGLAVFLVGMLLTVAAVRRVASLNPPPGSNQNEKPSTST